MRFAPRRGIFWRATWLSMRDFRSRQSSIACSLPTPKFAGATCAGFRRCSRGKGEEGRPGASQLVELKVVDARVSVLRHRSARARRPSRRASRRADDGGGTRARAEAPRRDRRLSSYRPERLPDRGDRLATSPTASTSASRSAPACFCRRRRSSGPGSWPTAVGCFTARY